MHRYFIHVFFYFTIPTFPPAPICSFRFSQLQVHRYFIQYSYLSTCLHYFTFLSSICLYVSMPCHILRLIYYKCTHTIPSVFPLLCLTTPLLLPSIPSYTSLSLPIIQSITLQSFIWFSCTLITSNLIPSKLCAYFLLFNSLMIFTLIIPTLRYVFSLSNGLVDKWVPRGTCGR